MARKGVERIAFEKFEKIAKQLGMVIVTKKGWTKFYAPGTDAAKTVRKPCLGVPNTKSVTIVELVNFEHELAVAHPKPAAESVRGMINFAQDAKLVLRDTYKVAKALCEAAVAPAPVEEPKAEEPAATEPAAETVAEVANG
jgi:hypothetical protein